MWAHINETWNALTCDMPSEYTITEKIPTNNSNKS